MGGKGRSSLLLLFVVAFIALMDGMDGSIINVALPALAVAMHTDTGTIAWVTVAYFMMIAGLILVFGKIASNGAIKKVMLSGLALFTVSSVLCGISDNLAMLVGARVLQGTGAAMMGATAPMICVRYLPAERLGLGLGVITLGSSLGYSVGPAVGGFIVDAISWHWCFFINIPLALLILPVMLKAVPKDYRETRIPLDKIGSLSFFTMVAAGIYALERCSHPGEEIPSAIAFAVSVFSLALFIRTERRSANPLLHIRAFRNRRFVSVLLSFSIINLVYMGLLYLIPFHLHANLGMNSLTSGLYLLLPSAITLLLVVPLSRMSDSKGRRPFAVAACAAMTAASIIWYAAAPSGSLPLIILSLVLFGLTWALCGGAMASRVVEEISDESHEIGSSLMTEGIYIGCAAGTALYAMMFTMYSGSGSTDFADLPAEVFLGGFMFVLAVSVVLSGIALLMSAAVSEKKSFQP